MVITNVEKIFFDWLLAQLPGESRSSASNGLCFSLAHRIFVVRWCGKAAGMPVAFQGFDASHGGKKTSDKLEDNPVEVLEQK